MEEVDLAGSALDVQVFPGLPLVQNLLEPLVDHAALDHLGNLTIENKE